MISAFVRANELLFRSDGILVVGSPMVDLVAHVDEGTLKRLGAKRSSAIAVSQVEFGEILGKLRRPVKRVLGGSAANVACALARMYGRTSLIGKIGVDPAGAFCREKLMQEGVNAWVSVDFEKPTGSVLVLVTPDGERSMVACLGASESFNVHELTGLEFNQMGIVHFEGYQLSDFEACVRMMKMAKGNNARVSLDLASYDWVKNKQEEFRFVIHEFVSYLFGNKSEMQRLTELEDPQEICQSLSMLVELVCLTDGAQGVWIGYGGVAHFFPADRVEPVDTTGAGDLFSAGVLHSIRWRWPLEKGIKFAQDLARTVVQREGAHLLDSDWDRFRKQYHLEQKLDSTGL